MDHRTVSVRHMLHALGASSRLVLLLSLAARAMAQAQDYQVRGRVVDLVTGAPVADAQVFLLGQRRPAVTDAAGHFRHTRLPASSCLLQVQKDGYVTMTWEVDAVTDTSLVHRLELRPDRVGALAPEAGGHSIRGRVVDAETGEPVPGVEVLVMGTPRSVATDAAGHFLYAGLAPTIHVIQARKIGYEPIAIDLAAAQDTAIVHVLHLRRAEVAVLDTLVVVGEAAGAETYWLRDFERRSTEGRRGQFVTRDQIVQRGAATLGDLLRTLNGLRLNCSTRGCWVQMTRGNCRPTYVADGMVADPVTVERMPVNDIYGIEVYDLFEVPIELQRSQLRCGVVSVWTRRGPPPRAK